MDRKVENLNERLRIAISRKNGAAIGKNSLAFNERVIIASPEFQEAIREARELLSDSQDDYCSDEICRLANTILEKLNLPSAGWLEYVEDILMYQDGSEYTTIGTSRIEVDSIGKFDGCLNIKLHRGLKKRDYIAAWGAFSKSLDQPPYWDTPSAEDLAQRMHDDHCRRKMSYGEIAKRYFPSEQSTPEKRKSATDKVKKRIKSYDKKLKGGEKKSI